MAPKDYTKLSEHLKCCVYHAQDGSGYRLEEHDYSRILENERFALFTPVTNFVCVGCFACTGDPKQHIRAKKPCGWYVAIRRVLAMYQQHGLPRHICPLTVSRMLHDPAVPLRPQDIIAQAPLWDPSNNFLIREHLGYRVNPALQNQNFDTMYANYVAQHNLERGVSANGLVPTDDLLSQALDNCNLVSDYDTQRRAVYHQFGRDFQDANMQGTTAYTAQQLEAEVDRRFESLLQSRIRDGTLSQLQDGTLVRGSDVEARVAARVAAAVQYSPNAQQLQAQIHSRFESLLEKRIRDGTLPQLRDGSLLLKSDADARVAAAVQNAEARVAAAVPNASNTQGTPATNTPDRIRADVERHFQKLLKRQIRDGTLQQLQDGTLLLKSEADAQVASKVEAAVQNEISARITAGTLVEHKDGDTHMSQVGTAGWMAAMKKDAHKKAKEEAEKNLDEKVEKIIQERLAKKELYATKEDWDRHASAVEAARDELISRSVEEQIRQKIQSGELTRTGKAGITNVTPHGGETSDEDQQKSEPGKAKRKLEFPDNHSHKSQKSSSDSERSDDV